MFWVVIIIIVAVIIIAVAYTNIKKKEQKEAILSDERLKDAKVFSEYINTPIAISENGYIGIINPKTKEPKIIHIKDINGFELLIDGKNIANIGGAVVGGLLFGGVGAIIGGSASKEKITKMNILFKTNDFNNPTIDIPLVIFEMKKGSMTYNSVQKEVQELMATLEIVEKNNKSGQ
jgi:hypothetical protein